MKLELDYVGCIPLEEVHANVRRHDALGIPCPKRSGRLALVGGGLSASEHIEDLINWPGDVWAINGAAQWCLHNSIDATLVTLHPNLELVPATRRAVLGAECSDELFAKCADKDICLLPTLDRGPTTATGVTIAAPRCGFSGITLFGCEGSYGAQTHNYEVYEDPNELWVVIAADGQTFRSKAEFFLQSRILADLIRGWPDNVEERSGGLLRALVNDPDYDVTDLAPALMEATTEVTPLTHALPTSRA